MPTPSEAPKKSRFRAQITNPLTGKRINVYADSEESLAHRVKRIRDLRDDLAAGVITAEAAGQAMRPYVEGPQTVEAVFKRYLSVVPETSRRLALANWKSRLEKWFKDMAPSALSREVMARWEREVIRRGDAPKTIRNAYDHLAGSLRLLVDSGELKELPWGQLSRGQGGTGWRPQKAEPRRKRQAAATMTQLLALLELAREDDRRNESRGFTDRFARLATLMLTGMRNAEGAGLAWDCLSIDEPLESSGVSRNFIRIQYQAKRSWHKEHPDWTRPLDPTKGRKDLMQNLHPTVVKILRAQRAKLMALGWYRLDGPVFPGKGGAWRTHGQTMKPELLRDYAKRAGFPRWEDWVTHSTRHSFATLEVIAHRGNLKATQARTGHSDVKQLEAYLHAAGENLGESAIPELPMPMTGVVRELGDGVAVVAADPWGFDTLPTAPALEAVSYDRNREFFERREQEKRILRERSELSFADLAVEWLALPKSERPKSGMPAEVILQGDRAAARNYRKGERAGRPVSECRLAARRGRIAVKAAWQKAIKNALARAVPLPELPAKPV